MLDNIITVLLIVAYFSSMIISMIVIYTDKKYTKLTVLQTIEWIFIVVIMPLIGIFFYWLYRPSYKKTNK